MIKIISFNKNPSWLLHNNVIKCTRKCKRKWGKKDTQNILHTFFDHFIRDCIYTLRIGTIINDGYFLNDFQHWINQIDYYSTTFEYKSKVFNSKQSDLWKYINQFDISNIKSKHSGDSDLWKYIEISLNKVHVDKCIKIKKN